MTQRARTQENGGRGKNLFALQTAYRVRKVCAAAWRTQKTFLRKGS